MGLMFTVTLIAMTAFWSVIAWKQFTGRVFEGSDR